MGPLTSGEFVLELVMPGVVFAIVYALAIVIARARPTAALARPRVWFGIDVFIVIWGLLFAGWVFLLAMPMTVLGRTWMSVGVIASASMLTAFLVFLGTASRLAAGGVMLAGGAAIAYEVLWRSLNWPERVTIAAGWRVWTPTVVWHAVADGALLGAALAARRTPVPRAGSCGRCGYDLSGVEAKVCPECGSKLMPGRA
jgi:hypothetical protein